MRRSKATISEYFPDVQTRFRLRLIRRTPSYRLGFALGSIPRSSPHYCYNHTHLRDVMAVLIVPYMQELRERGCDTSEEVYLRESLKYWQQVAIGWFDAGRDYPRGVTTENLLKQIKEALKNGDKRSDSD